MCETFWQSVQMKVHDADSKNEENQYYTHHNHERVCFTRGSDKKWWMGGRSSRVNRRSHTALPAEA
jgi:hypothetical protein